MSITPLQHTIVALMEDKPGVLNRVSSMVRRRGFNIASLSVGQSEQPGLSRMTFVVNGDGPVIEQVLKQLNRLVDVVTVSDITHDDVVSRELALIKVLATPSSRSEIIQLVDIFRSNIVDVSTDSIIVEITGDEHKVDSLLNLLKPFGIREIMRTGRIAMPRGGG